MYCPSLSSSTCTADTSLSALAGASAVAHVASDLSMSSDPNAVIPAVIAMTENILATANSTQSIKRVVLTSSTGAGAISQPGVEGIVVSEWTWNEFAKAQASSTPEEDPLKKLWVYCASKTEGEQAAWAYNQKTKVRRSLLSTSVLELQMMSSSFTAPL